MIESISPLRVRYAETDQMRFVHHSNYIIWFEYARVELFRKIGFSYAGLEKDGFLLPVLEVQVHYKKAARFDDLLSVVARIKERPRAKVKIEYEVLSEKGECICQGYTVHSFMNKSDRAIRPPKMFLGKMNEHFKD